MKYASLRRANDGVFMNAKGSLQILVLLFLFSTAAFGQNGSCPRIEIPDQVGPTTEGEELKFEVKAQAETPIKGYRWKLSAGTIKSGQGTASIIVDTRGLRGKNLEATVEIEGDFAVSCSLSESSTTIIIAPPEARLVNSIGYPNCEIAMAGLDGLAVEMQENRGSKGYVVVSGHLNGVIRARAAIFGYVSFRGVDPEAWAIVGKETKTELKFDLWIVPPGALLPASSAPNETAITTDPKKDFDDLREAEFQKKLGKGRPFVFEGERDVFSCGEIGGDLDRFAAALVRYPKARGNIVINPTVFEGFEARRDEILEFLVSKGVDRKRLRFFTKENIGMFEELWFLP